MRLAALDVGSNSVHLHVVRVLPDHAYETIHKDKAMVRLGSRTFSRGLLSEAAQNRAITVLGRYARVIRKFEVDAFIGVATSAVREASNGSAFLRRVRQATGLKIDRISGQEEARLVALAVGSLPPFDRGRRLVIDVGGGSTELAFLEDQEPRRVESFKMGCVRLAEEVPLPDRPGKKGLKELKHAALDRMGALLRRLRQQRFDSVAGTSGSTVCLGLLAARRTGQAVVRGETFGIQLSHLGDELAHLASLSLDERRDYMGEQAARADIILAGGAILLGILDEVANDEIFVPDRSIRDGMIVDFIRQRLEATPDDHVRGLARMTSRRGADPYDPRTVRERAVASLALRYGYESEHAHQVMRLAGQMFEATRELHRLGPDEKFYLEAAAVLHDVGHHIGYSQHHKHSLYLILNSSWPGFHDREIQVIGNVARYHRKGFPSLKHPEFAQLSVEDRGIVKRLAALLRVADALDYGHLSSVDRVRLERRGRQITFHVTANQECRAEVARASRLADLFERVYGLKVAFRSRRGRAAGKARVSAA